jgi:hypothetical protein
MSNTTLTIPVDPSLRRALQQRAQAQGKTISQVVLDLVQEGLTEQPLGSKISHLKGQLELPEQTADPWRKQLQERNWRS